MKIIIPFFFLLFSTIVILLLVQIDIQKIYDININNGSILTKILYINEYCNKYFLIE